MSKKLFKRRTNTHRIVVYLKTVCAKMATDSCIETLPRVSYAF